MHRRPFLADPCDSSRGLFISGRANSVLSRATQKSAKRKLLLVSLSLFAFFVALVNVAQQQKSSPGGGARRLDIGLDGGNMGPASSQTPLVAHLVPHSHCDAGYKKTLMGYLETEVASILHNVVEALEADSSRRFLWSEASYLTYWLQGEQPDMRERFKALVQRGQLEIVGGGWIMHDEAVTHYKDQVSQMMVGHVEILRPLLGKDFKIRHGWQIDPFGQGAFTPTMMAKAGVEAWVTNRVPQKEQRKLDKNLQFVWRGNSDLPRVDTEVFTHILDSHYESVDGFDWEKRGDPAPLVNATNVAERADIFVRELAKRREWYLTKGNILVPFGQDFRFQDANLEFSNMDKIIAFVEANPGRWKHLGLPSVTLRYSNLNDYFDALWTEAEREGVTFPERNQQQSSVLPLVDDYLHAWTGFYTGYPALKKAARELSSLVSSAEALHAAALLRGWQGAGRPEMKRLVRAQKLLDKARRTAGLLQVSPACAYACC